MCTATAPPSPKVDVAGIWPALAAAEDSTRRLRAETSRPSPALTAAILGDGAHIVAEHANGHADTRSVVARIERARTEPMPGTVTMEAFS